MTYKIIKKGILPVFLLFSMLFLSCSGEGLNIFDQKNSNKDKSTMAALAFLLNSPTEGKKRVSIYITDDLNSYKSVTVTLNSVEINSGSGSSCRLLSAPVTFNITELGLKKSIHFLDKVICDPVPYNRLNIGFDEAVTIVDASNGSHNCLLTAYKDHKNAVNALACTGGKCSISITGAINLLDADNDDGPGHDKDDDDGVDDDKIVLDFPLQDFEASFPPAGQCTVTFKVEPLHAEGLNGKHASGYKED